MPQVKEFEFPLSDINDLKVASEDKYYVQVKEDPVRSSIPQQQNTLTDIEDRLVRHPLQFYEHDNFDPLYMFIIKLKNLSSSIKTRLVEVLSNISTPLLNKVNSSVDHMQRREVCRNCIKMLSFLLCTIVRTLEREARSQAESASINSLSNNGRGRKNGKRKKQKRGRRKNTGHDDDDDDAMDYDWNGDKERLLAILCDILRQKNLVKLWEMNTPSEHFGNLFFNTAMSALENSKNHAANTSVIQQQIFDIIGLALSSYSTNVSASSQLIRMLQTAQWTGGADNKLAVVISQLIAVIVNKYNQPLILHEMMTEIGHLSGKDLARDTKGTKSLSFFLKEIADRLPHKVLSKISLVVNHLDQESYVMRNGIITMIGSLIEFAFTENDGNQQQQSNGNEPADDVLNDAYNTHVHGARNDDNREKQKKTKNDLFDMLETRILDINSYTRSKVLQTWSHLIEEKIVPVTRLCKTLIPVVRDRLQDKAALVRKQAIQILTVIVKKNPWGPLELDHEKAKLEMEALKHEIKRIENSLSKLELKLSHKLLKKQGIEFKLDDEENQDDDAEAEGEEDDEDEDGNHNRNKKKKNGKKQRKTKRRLNIETDEDSDEEMADLTDAANNDEEEQDEEEEEEEDESLEQMVARIGSFDQLKTQRKQLMMLELLVLFTNAMSECAVKMSQLLSSKTQSDVLECIEFFKVACTFKISNERLGFSRMLPLIWNRDNHAITMCVLKAYHYKYIQFTEDELADSNIYSDDQQSKESMKIATNLIKLINGATLADITCIEELIRLLVLNGQQSNVQDSAKNTDTSDVTIPNRVYSALWWIFEGKLRDVTVAQRRGALDILRMAGAAKKSIILSKISCIVRIGFGPIAQGDAGMARSACMALNVVFTENATEDAPQKNLSQQINAEMKQTILRYISYIQRGGFIQSKHWFATCQEAMNLLFSTYLCERPDLFIQNIIKTIAVNLFKKKQHGDNIEVEADEDEKEHEPPAQGDEHDINNENCIFYKRYDLAKFLFILGNTAIKLLVYIEQKENELKKLKEKEKEKDNKANEANNRNDNNQNNRNKNNNRNKDKSRRNPRNRSRSGNNNEDHKNDEDTDYELNEAMGGSGVEDYEIEQMKNRAETSIVDRDSLLGKFTPIILHIIGDPQQYNCTILQSSAVLAFTKYMCISSAFCENNLRILFTLLEKHSDPSIRANIIIALGDMAFRFPNELDQWSTNIYRNLRDENVIVRKNTLMVLTHLILNDMIKVRDSISEIALLLEDPVASISDLARLFFQELSKKGKNPIYNILPDTISRLSNNESVSEKTFKYIMKFLLAFITKDKQKENLIEKLCNRFNSSNDIKAWRYIAYCLSLLNYSDRLMKKIGDEELVKKYQDKLYDDEIFAYFKEIQNKCKKHVTQQYKETFDCWCNYMAERHLAQKNDNEADERGVEKLGKYKHRATSKSNKNGSRSRSHSRSTSPAKRGRGARGGRGRGRGGRKRGGGRKRADESEDDEESSDLDMELRSDDDEETDDEEVESESGVQEEEENNEKENKSKRGNKGTRKSQRKKTQKRKQVESESEEDEDDDLEESESEDDDEEEEEEESVKPKGRGRGRVSARGRGRSTVKRGRGRGRAAGGAAKKGTARARGRGRGRGRGARGRGRGNAKRSSKREADATSSEEAESVDEEVSASEE
eukprot:CAMPEP_0197073468 /NCGR_PEP_ID=MMETSP1384-20130603/210621_1 /TAXON_ID=29189 /ORGANISM="Ammonia sp." /LENGTH=1672 /DNA_ID=CAMNT_0042512305 /DNA_START=42 /DNA_END=5060 /DNA_ORIENTATION=-